METDLSPELGRHGFRRRLSRTWIQGKEGGGDNDVPLVEFMYFYLHACQVRVTAGDSGLCCCTRVTYFDR